MDAREYLAALLGEQGADRVERMITHDLRAQRLALEPLHDEALAQAVLGGEHVQDLGLGHAGRARGAHQHGFGDQARLAGAGLRRHAARRAAHRELSLARVRANHQAIGFLTRAAGESLGRHEAAAAADP